MKVLVNGIKSGKASNSIFTFYHGNTLLNVPPFVWKNPSEEYHYHHHLDAVDLGRIQTKFPQIHPYNSRSYKGIYEYRQAMGDAFYEIIRSGKMVEVMSLAMKREWAAELVVEWDGPKPEYW